jgi:hypothetical protein
MEDIMKTLGKISLLAVVAGLLSLTDMLPQLPSYLPGQLQLVDEAHAILGVRRRAVRRGVVIGASMATVGAAAATTAAAAPAPAPAPAAAPAPAPAPTTSQPAGTPPLGSIVNTLPAGCVKSPQGGVEYYNCGGVYYRTAFQGSNLVYVVAQP